MDWLSLNVGIASNRQGELPTPTMNAHVLYICSYRICQPLYQEKVRMEIEFMHFDKIPHFIEQFGYPSTCIRVNMTCLNSN